MGQFASQTPICKTCQPVDERFNVQWLSPNLATGQRAGAASKCKSCAANGRCRRSRACFEEVLAKRRAVVEEVGAFLWQTHDPAKAKRWLLQAPLPLEALPSNSKTRPTLEKYIRPPHKRTGASLVINMTQPLSLFRYLKTSQFTLPESEISPWSGLRCQLFMSFAKVYLHRSICLMLVLRSLLQHPGLWLAHVPPRLGISGQTCSSCPVMGPNAQGTSLFPLLPDLAASATQESPLPLRTSLGTWQCAAGRHVTWARRALNLQLPRFQ